MRQERQKYRKKIEIHTERKNKITRKKLKKGDTHRRKKTYSKRMRGRRQTERKRTKRLK